MKLHSSLVCLLLLLVLALHLVSAAVVPDGEVARKLEADLFEMSTPLEDGELTERNEEDVEKAEGLTEKLTESVRRRDVLVPAGWRRFRRRISRAFRRVGDGIRRVFRGPWNICFPNCGNKVRRPGQWNA